MIWRAFLLNTSLDTVFNFPMTILMLILEFISLELKTHSVSSTYIAPSWVNLELGSALLWRFRKQIWRFLSKLVLSIPLSTDRHYGTDCGCIFVRKKFRSSSVLTCSYPRLSASENYFNKLIRSQVAELEGMTTCVLM